MSLRPSQIRARAIADAQRRARGALQQGDPAAEPAIRGFASQRSGMSVLGAPPPPFASWKAWIAKVLLGR